MPWNWGTPQLALLTSTGSAPSIERTDTSVSLAPTPQLAPMASGGCGRSASVAANWSGSSPIIVRPAVSNEQVTVYGMPSAMAASAAAWNSSMADIVSIQITSAPPSLRPRISSRKTATASSWVSLPSGSNSSPVGPTDPPTTTGWGAASATSRARRAAPAASSCTRASALCSWRRLALQPNVLVRMMSDPASTNCWCRPFTRSGWSTVQNSGGSPEVSPAAK